MNVNQMTLQDLQSLPISFGKAKLGQTFEEAFKDQAWTKWCVSHYEHSQKIELVKFLRFVSLQITEGAAGSLRIFLPKTFQSLKMMICFAVRTTSRRNKHGDSKSTCHPRTLTWWRNDPQPEAVAFLVSAAKNQKTEVKMSTLTEQEKKMFVEAKKRNCKAGLTHRLCARYSVTKYQKAVLLSAG